MSQPFDTLNRFMVGSGTATPEKGGVTILLPAHGHLTAMEVRQLIAYLSVIGDVPRDVVEADRRELEAT